MELIIKTYIEEHIPELKGHVWPVFTAEIERTNLVYTVTPVSAGHMNQSQLELKIVGRDYDECKAMENALKGLLAMEEDHPYIRADGISFFSQLSGGGTLFNDAVQMYEDTLFFIIDWR